MSCQWLERNPRTVDRGVHAATPSLFRRRRKKPLVPFISCLLVRQGSIIPRVEVNCRGLLRRPYNGLFRLCSIPAYRQQTFRRDQTNSLEKTHIVSSQEVAASPRCQVTASDWEKCYFYFTHFNNNYRATFTQANNYIEECRIYILTRALLRLVWPKSRITRTPLARRRWKSLIHQRDVTIEWILMILQEHPRGRQIPNLLTWRDRRTH